MYRPVFPVALYFFLSLFQPVAAAPQDNATIVADYLLTDQTLTQIRDSLRHRRARQVRDLLSPHPVRIFDLDRLEAAIPQDMIDPWIAQADKLATQLAIQRIPPAELAQIASTLRAEFSELDAHTGFQLVTLLAVVTMHLEHDLSSDPLPPSAVADLLEIDGLFHFPNRIYRRDLIRELRAARP